MATKAPEEITEAAVETGVKKARVSWNKALVGGFLAGAYIAFGGLVSIAVTSGLDPETWGTLPTLFAGAVFSIGLILVVVAGSDLLTGNMALVPLAAMRKRVGFGQLTSNFAWVLVGNLIGSLFVAYFLAVATGVIGTDGGEAGTPGALMFDKLNQIAQLKGNTESAWQIFLRAMGCNWLVCLAVWLAHRHQRPERQDPRDLLPDPGLRGDRLRPRGGQHVLPAGRHLRRGPGPRVGRRAQQLGVRLPRQPGRRGDLRLLGLLLPPPQGGRRGRGEGQGPESRRGRGDHR